jgi:hypothetical protein
MCQTAVCLNSHIRVQWYETTYCCLCKIKITTIYYQLQNDTMKAHPYVSEIVRLSLSPQNAADSGIHCRTFILRANRLEHAFWACTFLQAWQVLNNARKGGKYTIVLHSPVAHVSGCVHTHQTDPLALRWKARWVRHYTAVIRASIISPRSISAHPTTSVFWCVTI